MPASGGGKGKDCCPLLPPLTFAVVIVIVEEAKVTKLSIADGAGVMVVAAEEAMEMAEALGNGGFEVKVGGGLSEPSGPSPSAGMESSEEASKVMDDLNRDDDGVKLGKANV